MVRLSAHLQTNHLRDVIKYKQSTYAYNSFMKANRRTTNQRAKPKPEASVMDAAAVLRQGRPSKRWFPYQFIFIRTRSSDDIIGSPSNLPFSQAYVFGYKIPLF